MKNKFKHKNGGELFPNLSTLAGMGIGSLIAPGIGTSVGGFIGNKVGNFVNNQFENGGKLTKIKGNTHSNGGVTLPGGINEVEDKETIINDFVFSNNLPYNKKQSFADKSKSIDKKYFRDNDKIDAMGKKLELEKLSQQQENMKKSIYTDMTNKYMYGGKMKKKYLNGGSTDDEYIDLYGNKDIQFSQPIVNQGSGLITPTFYNQPAITEPNSNSNITPNVISNQYVNPISNKLNYGNIIPQLAGDAYNILQGVKGGDDVNFQRVTPTLANPNSAITANNNISSTSYNNARNAIRNSATSSGEYLSMMNSLSGKELLNRGLNRANIKSDYDKINTGIINNASGANSQIQINEAIARQQETDASRSAVSKGLSDLGSKIGMINNEKNIRNNQKDLLSLMSKNGYRLIRDNNGEMSWEKNGSYIPYEVGIKSVFNQ